MDKEKIYLEQSLCTAIKDVIETMTGLNVKETNENIMDNICKGEISGAMIIVGQNSTLMSITMSMELASTIICYMTGIDPSDLSNEEIYDGVAELINMIAGRTKALLVGTKYHFNITPPFTIIGKNHFILQKNINYKITQRYYIDDKEIYLEVYYAY